MNIRPNAKTRAHLLGDLKDIENMCAIARVAIAEGTTLRNCEMHFDGLRETAAAVVRELYLLRNRLEQAA